MTRMQILRRRIRQLTANHGAVVTLSYLPELLWQTFVVGQPCAHWPDPSGIEFDATYGVSTTGITPIAHLEVDTPNWVYGLDYQAVEVFDIESLLAECAIDYPHTVFIDLGAGKGRVLMFASVLPFKHLLGVEISAELVRIAEHNLAVFARTAGCSRDRVIMQGDAASFVFPPEPLVIFMYNPFSVPVMEAVIANLVESVRLQPRRIIVIYFRPELSSMWLTAPGFRQIASGERYRIYEHDPSPRRRSSPIKLFNVLR
jgi:hypothetical protein